MAFKQAASNPFQHLADGSLSVKSVPPVMPAMGMPNPYPSAVAQICWRWASARPSPENA